MKHNSTIKTLNVSWTQIGDRDVETLLMMTKLNTVNVAYASITEQGLMRLATHPTLRRLNVGTGVPEATVIALRSHLACHVVE